MKLNFFSIFCAFVLSVFCQQLNASFIPGIVINKGGDTIAGVIEKVGYIETPKYIHFKKNGSSQKVKYSAKDIKGFVMDNEVYVSADVEVESAHEKKDYDEKSEITTNKQHVFLLELIGGTKALYVHFRNNSSKNLYYIKRDNLYELLVYKKFLKSTNEAMVFEENKSFEENMTYRKQLYTYLGPCGEMDSVVNHAAYKRKDLVDVFRYYYRCVNIRVPYKHKRKQNLIAYGPMAQLSFMSNLYVGDKAYAYLTNMKFSNSAVPAFGGFFEISFGHFRNKLGLLGELTYSSFKSNGENEIILSPSAYYNYQAKFAGSNLKLITAVNYYFDQGRKFSMNAGLVNGLLISKYDSLASESYYFGVRNSYNNTLFLHKKHSNIGFTAGVQAKFWRLRLGARIETISGFENKPYLFQRFKNYTFSAAYTF